MTHLRTLSAASLAILLSSCADRSLDKVGDLGDDAAAEYVRSESALRLDVYPSGGGDLLPQSFTVLPEDIGGIALELSPTVTVRGTVTGSTPSPVDITIPSDEELPVVARVTLEVPGTVVRVSTTSTELGNFTAEVPAGFGYRLIAVAEDPVELPLFIEDDLVLADDTRIDPHLGLGAALGGVAEQSDGSALPSDARLSLVDIQTGERGPFTSPSPEGGWLLRALPGRYQLVVDGRPGSTMPTLSEQVVIREDDVFVEVDVVPGILETGTVSGSVVDTDGRPIDGAEVRFTALSLDGLIEGASATGTFSTDTDRNGLFSRVLARGEWLMEVMPDFERPFVASPGVYSFTLDGSALALGATALSGRSRLDARVFVGGGAAHDIVVTAQELGFNRYTYTATTDIDGWVHLDVSDVPLQITLQSPDASQPITRVDITSPGSVDRLQIEDEGSMVRGTLYSPEGGTLAYALVEIRNSSGLLLGATLTDGSGDFSVTVGLLDDGDRDTGE